MKTQKEKSHDKGSKSNDEFENEDTLTAWICEKFIKSFGKIYILSLVSKGYNHGYKILKFLKDNFSIDVSAPLIYFVLNELEKRGFIKGVWKHEEGKPDKKEYMITEKGVKLLEMARKKILDLSHNMLKNGEH